MKKLNIHGLFMIIFFGFECNLLIGSQKISRPLVKEHVLEHSMQNIPVQNDVIIDDNQLHYPFTLSLDAINEESKRAEAIWNFISHYPLVQQGFDLLPRHDMQFDSFYETVDRLLVADILDDHYVFHKDGLEFSDIIDEVTKELFEYMKGPFFEALIDAFEKNQGENKLNWYYLQNGYHHADMHIDGMFHYVIFYKDSFMKDTVDQWIKDWFENGGQEILYQVIESKNFNKILVLLGLPINLSLVTGQDQSMLFAAIEGENIQLLKEILKLVDNPENLDSIINKFDDQGMIPLDYAVIKNNERIVDLLLQVGARVDWQNGYTNPLHAAVFYGYEKIVKQLLWKNPGIVDVRDGMNRTPLYLASLPDALDHNSQAVRENIVQLLLSFGAKVNTFCNGYTPLHLAAARGYYNIAKILLEGGADANISFYNAGIETPLWSAVLHDNVSIDMIKLLIEHGAEINNKIDENGISLLGYVLNYPDILELLLQNGADPNLVDLDESGTIEMPLLHKAVVAENMTAIKILLDYSADINALGGIDRGTALHEAVQVGNAEIVQLLLELGADRLMVNGQGLTPLEVEQDQLLNLEKSLNLKLTDRTVEGLQEKNQLAMPSIIGMLS